MTSGRQSEAVSLSPSAPGIKPESSPHAAKPEKRLPRFVFITDDELEAMDVPPQPSPHEAKPERARYAFRTMADAMKAPKIIMPKPKQNQAEKQVATDYFAQEEIAAAQKLRSERALRYGKFYWIVSLDKEEISFNADAVRIVDGALVAYYLQDGVELPSYFWAPGVWKECYAASVFDGSPVCVDNIFKPQPRPRLTR